MHYALASMTLRPVEAVNEYNYLKNEFYFHSGSVSPTCMASIFLDFTGLNLIEWVTVFHIKIFIICNQCSVWYLYFKGTNADLILKYSLLKYQSCPDSLGCLKLTHLHELSYHISIKNNHHMEDWQKEIVARERS